MFWEGISLNDRREREVVKKGSNTTCEYIKFIFEHDGFIVRTASYIQNFIFILMNENSPP